MKKIASFTIDHIKLQPGIYVSRKDYLGDQVITTFDKMCIRDSFHTAVCDHLHFFFHLFHGKLHAADMVIAVKSAVYAIVFAVIGNI